MARCPICNLNVPREPQLDEHGKCDTCNKDVILQEDKMKCLVSSSSQKWQLIDHKIKEGEIHCKVCGEKVDHQPEVTNEGHCSLCHKKLDITDE